MKLLLAMLALASLFSAPAPAKPVPTLLRGSVQPTPRVDPRAGGLTVGMGEWAMAPEVPAIRPGAVTFVIRNNGKFAHGFRIKEESDRSGGDRIEVRSGTLGPGQTQRVTVNLPAGSYSIECFVEGHDDRGMETPFQVRADAPFVRPAKASANTARIQAFAYKPGTITVNTGTTIRWTNLDPAPHTVTSANGSFTSKTLNKGGVYSRRFTRAGRYGYVCALHPGMKGAVVVR